MALFPKNDPIKADIPADIPEVQTMETKPPFDPTLFKSFADASVDVDKATRMATVTIRMQNSVTVRIELPEPMLAAWSTDNAAGKLLADAGNLKV